MDLTFLLKLRPIVTAIIVIIMFAYIRRFFNGSKRRFLLRRKVDSFLQQEDQRRQRIRQIDIADDFVNEILCLSFSELRQRLSNGKLCAIDVLQAFQKAALQSSDDTNAVTEFVPSADAAAQRLDTLKTGRKSLHGIPVSVKECCFITGTESTEGHGQYIGRWVDHETAPIVRFVEDHGCVPFVKTNTPQAMMSFDSRNAIFGVTKNPYNLLRSPGGSSSGEGALIGARASVIGIGSDTGGSLRIPAAWCGCYTLKPTSGRMLRGGMYPAQTYYSRTIVHDFNAMGFMTREIDALILLHRLLYSKETFDKYLFNSLAPVPFREDLFESTPEKGLTIGFCFSDGVIEAVPAMKRAVDMARWELERRGHRLVEWTAPRPREAFLLYLRAMTLDGNKVDVKNIEQDIEICHQNKMSMKLRKMPYWIKRIISSVVRCAIGDLPADVLQAVREGRHPHDANIQLQQVKAYRREFDSAFRDASLDALLWPAFPCPALPVDSPKDALAALNYTALFNLVDWPAGVCPITRVTADDEAEMAMYPGDNDIFHTVIARSFLEGTQGLPLGVQVAAPQFREEVVLRIMSELAENFKY